jgi:hypothetical protein
MTSLYNERAQYVLVGNRESRIFLKYEKGVYNDLATISIV